MIFIGGISDGIKEIFYNNKVYCRFCGERSAVRILMTYTYFSFFFLPLFKWNRHFYVEFGCCGRQYELKKEVGMQLLRGMEAEITPDDLTPTGQRRENWQKDYGPGWNETPAERSQEAAFQQAENPEAAPYGVKALTAAAEPAKESTQKDETDRRYCPHCGKEIDVKFSYCPHCGGKL